MRVSCYYYFFVKSGQNIIGAENNYNFNNGNYFFLSVYLLCVTK